MIPIDAPVETIAINSPVSTTAINSPVDTTVTNLLDGSTVLATIETPMTDDDRAELTTLETTVETGVARFVAVGSALMAIRERRLWRDGYASFNTYLKDRWGFSPQFASLSIKGATTSKSLVAAGLPAPATESAVRPLTRLDGPVATAVWAKAGGIAGENHPVTSAHVGAAMAEMGLTKEVKVRTPAPPVVPTLEAVLARFRAEIAIAIAAMNTIDGAADLEWTDVLAMLTTEITSVIAETDDDDDDETD